VLVTLLVTVRLVSLVLVSVLDTVDVLVSLVLVSVLVTVVVLV
jgi:hypothetical protein